MVGWSILRYRLLEANLLVVSQLSLSPRHWPPASLLPEPSMVLSPINTTEQIPCLPPQKGIAFGDFLRVFCINSSQKLTVSKISRNKEKLAMLEDTLNEALETRGLH